MKALITFIISTSLFLFSSCDKEDDNFKETTSLQGKWKLIETYADPGDGSGTYQPVSDNIKEYIEFGDSGKLIVTTGGYTSYRLQDSFTLVFVKPNSGEQRFIFTLENNTLTMSPSGPIWCIEGCGSRYKRIK